MPNNFRLNLIRFKLKINNVYRNVYKISNKVNLRYSLNALMLTSKEIHVQVKSQEKVICYDVNCPGTNNS